MNEYPGTRVAVPPGTDVVVLIIRGSVCGGTGSGMGCSLPWWVCRGSWWGVTSGTSKALRVPVV